MSKRVLGMFLAMVICLLPMSVGIEAAEPPDYLALGDSISTGYGLTAVESECFVNQLAVQLDCSLTNISVNGNTAEGVYEQLRHGEMDTLLTDAELITLTCGGNDLMAVLYEMVAQAYNEDHADVPIAAEDVIVILGGTHETLKQSDLLNYATTVLTDFSESKQFSDGLDAFVVSLSNVMSYIRTVNPSAVVVIPTQYNPYKSFKNHFIYKMIYEEIEAGVVLLNGEIKRNAAELGYTAADVYTAFSSPNLCNASAPLFGSPNLDFHPNAAGHVVIKDTIAAVIPTPLVRYTITFDGNSGDNVPSAMMARGGTVVVLPAEEPVLTGCSFLGWATDPAAVKVEYVPGGTYTVTADAVLYAVWEKSRVPGDVNGDGLVNLADAAYLKCHLSAAQSYPIEAGAGDYNGDGSIDIDDAAELMWDILD